MTENPTKSTLWYAKAEINFNDFHWNSSILENFYENIKDIFPKKEIRTNKNIEVNHKENGEVEIVDNGLENVWICKTADEQTVINLSKNRLELVFLSYSSWEDTKKLVIEIAERYKNVTQMPIFMIALKYLHKINIGEKSTYENLKKYFTFVPQIPLFEKGNNAESIQMRAEMLRKPDILMMTLATLLPEFEMLAPVVLELFFSSLSTPAGWTLETWLEQAHDQIKEAFEMSITDWTKQNYEYDTF